MKRIDNVASLAARRHARVRECVTASIDSSDFLHPITQSESVCIEAFVSSTGNKSMGGLCKVITEDMMTEDRKVAATSFLPCLALDDPQRPIQVHAVAPDTAKDEYHYHSVAQRATMRRERRVHSNELTQKNSVDDAWDKETKGVVFMYANQKTVRRMQDELD